ncbi:NAD(P)H-dependent oxidoreductase [Bacteroidota bacterium]
MNHLIIIAHPKEESFSQLIRKELEFRFEEKGDHVKIRDLYKMNFNPVLTEGELKYIKEGNVCPDILVEQSYILWADEITMIYPLWWNAFPAIMKGYIDRVFTNGFAFTITDKGTIGLLKEKKVRLITTAGMTEESLKQENVYEGLNITQDHGVFEFCGMEVIDHLYVTEVTSLSEEEKREELNRLNERILEKELKKVYEGKG